MGALEGRDCGEGCGGADPCACLGGESAWCEVDTVGVRLVGADLRGLAFEGDVRGMDFLGLGCEVVREIMARGKKKYENR